MHYMSLMMMCFKADGFKCNYETIDWTLLGKFSVDILKTFGDCMQEQPRGGEYNLVYFEQV